MDYQEAIKRHIEECENRIDVIDNFMKTNGDADKDKCIENIEIFKIAISAMQELQIYKDNEKRNLSRTDRLMDECTYRHENGNCLRVGGFCTSVPLSNCQRYKDWYTDYRGYKQLGTLEEVREVVEKQKAKKPKNVNTEGYRYTDTYRCPACGGNFSGTGIADYCYHCGQHIDWSEKE